MLFAPPEVKSLSKYSEFGSHLQSRHFLLMVLAAILLHVAIGAVYSMTPHEIPTIIPVRALNIKLNSGSASGELDIPKAESMPGYKEAESTPQGNILSVRENHEPAPSRPAAHENTVIDKHKQLISILTEEEKNANTVIPRNHVFQKPKKYIREDEKQIAMYDKSGNGHGNGSPSRGSKEGQEIIRNYEQEISLWIKSHPVYPELARRQHLEGNPVVRIRITSDGHIVYNAIETSSGNAIIDQAALDTISRSNPLPRVPSNYPSDEKMEFLIPVSFSLE